MLCSHQSAFPLALLAAAWATGAQGAPPLRREAQATFLPDEAFQADGGVQVYFDLVHAGPGAWARSDGFAHFRPLDAAGRWDAQPAPLHVGMLRVVYTLEKDAGFFTARRVGDLTYIRAIAPDMEVTQSAPGRFRVGRVPANDFTLAFLDEADIDAQRRTPAVAQVLALLEGGPPRSLVVQENTGFARILGVRTGEFSVTWTAHQPLRPGAVRVSVLTLNYLHTLPPPFLGGEARLERETLEYTLAFIARLRAWEDPGPG